MSRFIASARNPRWPAQESELRALFGITGSKWPTQGCKPREIQGIWVHVLPVDHFSLINWTTGKKRSRAQHRCLATCPECGAQVSAGRLQQHRCDARVSKEEALRRFEFRKTLCWTQTQAELHTRAIAAFEAPFDTQEQDDAVNAFCELAAEWMTPAQRAEWDSWCLKATLHEIVNEALRILGMAEQPVPAATA